MNDDTTMLLAASFELGVPITLALIAALRPTLRKWIVVVLGSITPLLLFYVVTGIRYFAFTDTGAALAFEPMWAMSFVPYIACLAIGCAIAMVRVPRGLSARYILGLIPTAVTAVVLGIFMLQ